MCEQIKVNLGVLFAVSNVKANTCFVPLILFARRAKRERKVKSRSAAHLPSSAKKEFWSLLESERS